MEDAYGYMDTYMDAPIHGYICILTLHPILALPQNKANNTTGLGVNGYHGLSSNHQGASRLARTTAVRELHDHLQSSDVL